MLPGNNPDVRERILIHAPYGRDASLIETELETAGFYAVVCTSVEQLAIRIGEGAGAALVADEALIPPAIQCLAAQLSNQPRWSDFPLLIMTSGGGSTKASRYRLSLLGPLGNVTLMERPLRPITLVSSLHAALRARRHQYQLREYVERIEASERALRKSEARIRFLSDLAEAIRSATKPDEAGSIAAQILGAHLRVSHAVYATVGPETGEPALHPGYPADPSVNEKAHWRMFFNARVMARMRGGRSLILSDAAEVQDVFSETGIAAAICCPLLKDGVLVALMAVDQTAPREWTREEVELVQVVAERCWAFIEREHLAQQLAENNRILQRTNSELMVANRELEEFAHVASHDLQEPLRMVKIYTELILKSLDRPDATLAQYGNFVRQGASRMEDLISDLLSFSRASHVEARDKGVADLSAALASAMVVLRNGIEETGAVITAAELPVVRGDTAQISHVFQNLISNSLKYRKSSVPLRIDISAARDDGQWVVAVQDNGIGFEQCYAERIFGLFKRLHTDEYPGTGLGLAICQRIVGRYGGRIWAIGEPENGATFHFSLPAAPR